MKHIAGVTGAKLRLRGQGSKFLEGPEQKESSDPLMLCISAPDVSGYEEAVRLVRERLEVIYAEYRQFCARSRLPSPQVEVQMHEGAREGSR